MCGPFNILVGVRGQLEKVGCVFPWCGFWACAFSRHQAWWSEPLCYLLNRLTRGFTQPILCGYSGNLKVVRNIYISCNSHRHLHGTLQLSLNICIFWIWFGPLASCSDALWRCGGPSKQWKELNFMASGSLLWLLLVFVFIPLPKQLEKVFFYLGDPFPKTVVGGSVTCSAL